MHSTNSRDTFPVSLMLSLDKFRLLQDEEPSIALSGKDSKDIEEFTFEFYDMKSEYVESITALLKGVFTNPTTSYEIASAVVAQGTLRITIHQHHGIYPTMTNVSCMF